MLKDPRKKKKPINIQGNTSYKLTKEPGGTIGMPVMKDCCGFCLEKRQQSSSAVIFARLRSNGRYTPGD